MKNSLLSLLLILSTGLAKPASGKSLYQSPVVQSDTFSNLLNKPAPDFKLKDIDGKAWSLSELQGKVVVLNFWFILCKPCVAEMTSLNRIKKSYAPGKVVFLALSTDNNEAIKSFLKTHTFDYNILPNASKIGELYDIYAYPTSMVIDRNGIIRFIQVGGPNIEDNLRSAINKASK